MSEVFDYCHVAELTDVGCKRSANEDWYAHFESPNGLVAVVCDGMGGHVGGQIASHTAVEAIRQYMMQERSNTPSELIVEAINAANTAILNRAIQQPELTGMGSTCVMLVVRGGKVYIGSVGDSRVYLIRNHRIRQLTVDQSYVQMLVDAGSITPEQAERHPRKNEITNALGLKGMQPATVLPEAFIPDAGDCFLLCSDGLTGMVSDSDICKVVSRQGERTQQERVEELIMRAKRNGGMDNITCQIVEFSVNPNRKEIQPWWKKNFWPLIGIAVALILLATLLTWHFYNKEDGYKEQEHSEQVKNLIETTDSVIILKSIRFATGLTFMELTEDKDFGGMKLLQKLSPKDTTIIIKYPLSLKHLGITPNTDCINVEYTNEDSTKCFLTFKKELGNEKEISVTIRSNDEKGKSYLFIMPVEKPIENSVVGEENKIGKRVRPEEWEANTAISITEDMHSSNEDCKVLIGIQNQSVTLWSKKGKNTNTDIYFPDYAFTQTCEETDKGWYVIKNNGAECVLIIKNTLQHPIPQKDAIIYIPTEPECNDGKGIIIRINKIK